MTVEAISTNLLAHGYGQVSKNDGNTNCLSALPVSSRTYCEKQAFSEIEKSRRYNAPYPQSSQYVELSETLWSQVENCLNHDLPMISFQSRRGFKHCSQLLSGHGNSQDNLKKSSVLLLLLQHTAPAVDPRQLTISTPNGDVVITIKNIKVSGHESTIPSIEAELEVQGPGHNESKTLSILEMAPFYDGIALKETELIKCFNLAKAFQQAHQKMEGPLFGQFSSSKGIGRSAALLILSQFEDFVDHPDTPLNKIPTSYQQVEFKIDELIKNIRQQTGDTKFVHTKDQGAEIVKACFELLKNKNEIFEQQTLFYGLQTSALKTPVQKQTAYAPNPPAKNKSSKIGSDSPPVPSQLPSVSVKPLALPYKRHDQKGYKEASLQMQCGKQALNCFFQAPVFTSKKIASKWASQLLARLCDFGYSGVGLYKQSLLQEISDDGNKEVTVRKEDIVSSEYDRRLKRNLDSPTVYNQAELSLYVGDNRSTEEMWRQLIGLKSSDNSIRAKYDEFNQISELKITASDWFSCMPGLGMHQAQDMLNDTIIRLKATENAAWSHLPGQVTYIYLRDQPNHGKFKDFQDQINDYIDSNPEKQVALILLTGTDPEAGNHYFTIIYQPQTESWLNLNAEGAVKNGLQSVSVYCKKAKLAKTLEKKDPVIQAVLSPVSLEV